MATPQNSTFNFTDSGVTPFVVKPFTANGPQTPSSSTLYTNPEGVGAVSANTSLVLVGRGTPYYGEVVQSNMVYLLEHFANRSRPQFPVMGQIWYKKQNYTDSNFPLDPTSKGLYLWNGTAWDPIQIKGTSSTAELNMGGFRITNVGDPSSAQDAVNLRAGDARYVRATGSDMDGTFIVLSGSFHVDTGARLSCSEMPTDPIHVVNLQYLDLVSNGLSADISSVDQRIDNIVLNGGAYASTSGATFTGPVVLASAATLIAQSGGAAFSLGGRSISNIALLPTDDADAASKKYVDDSIATVNTSIGSTNNAIVTLQTGLTTVYAAISGTTFTGNVTIGAGANFTLAGSAASATVGGRRLQNVGAPTVGTDAATKTYVDNAFAARKSRSFVYVAAGSASSITLPGSMTYTVGSNALTIYRNGLKWVASRYGKAVVSVTGSGLSGTSDTGLVSATTYTVDVTLDAGTLKTLSITTPAGVTDFNTLVSLLNNAAGTAGSPAFFVLDAYSANAMDIIVYSSTTGATSTVTVSYAVGSVFKAATGTVAPVSTAGVAYNYAETGVIGTASNQVSFVATPTNGDILEFVLA